MLELTLLARGYVPGGVELGGVALCPLAPAVPAVRLGVSLPAPPAPLSLDDGDGDAVLEATTARWVSGSVPRGGLGLSPRFRDPAAKLLNASFSLASLPPDFHPPTDASSQFPPRPPLFPPPTGARAHRR